MTVLWIGLAGALGAALRHLVESVLARHGGGRLPWGLLVVNTCGSFVLGVLVGADAGPDALRVVGAGLCGALTTFGAVSLDVAQRWRASRADAVAAGAAVLVAAVAAAAAGHAAGA